MESSTLWDTPERAFQFKQLSFGFAFAKRQKVIHQLELHQVLYKPITSKNSEIQKLELSLQYHRSQKIWSNHKENFQLLISQYVGLMYGFVDAPIPHSGFPEITRIKNAFQVSVGVSAELNYHLNSKLFLILRTPMEFFSFGVHYDTYLFRGIRKRIEWESYFSKRKFFPRLGSWVFTMRAAFHESENKKMLILIASFEQLTFFLVSIFE